MPRVIHFEISADDVRRAKKFYSDLFGWDIQEWAGPRPEEAGEARDYCMVRTGRESEPGIDGAIFKRDGPTNYVCTIDVPSLDQYLDKVTASGGKVVVPRMPIPGVGYKAYCQDTENNVFGIVQLDNTAK